MTARLLECPGELVECQSLVAAERAMGKHKGSWRLAWLEILEYLLRQVVAMRMISQYMST